MVIYSEGKWISSACIKKGLPYADTLPYADKQKNDKVSYTCNWCGISMVP